MTNLQTSITTLVSIADKSGIAADFLKCSLEQLDVVAAKLPLSQELKSWYQWANPQNVRIPWSTGRLLLYSLNSLVVSQDGYRWLKGQREQLLDGWNSTWVVIGDVDADPVIAHVDQPQTPISMAFHGMGEWTLHTIAPSLDAYLNAITVWIDVSLCKYRGRIEDEDGAMLRQVVNDLSKNLEGVLNNECRTNFLLYLE